ncbi:hypothetical protein [Paenibacillus sp. 481]|uniref:hypothetical protein n=1 Tax=Paenibacillus sp. 481 TaxID=2835869 RepID=UPI001E32AC38|nr:hypothetical protein [Paenibacillus sp. 481]UHA74016.1 hypothetical protein KIK04_02325 [Paenibacillus sp. 481]
MSKKLEKNGLWESSRMMLPQHKEAFQNRFHPHTVQPCRPTTEEIKLMKDSVLLSIMHTIIIKKAYEIEQSSDTLRGLYTKVARLLAKNIYADLCEVKKYLLEKNICLHEEEKDEQAIHYRYVCRHYEDRFIVTRDYIRSEVSTRIGRYADTLVASLHPKQTPCKKETAKSK